MIVPFPRRQAKWLPISAGTRRVRKPLGFWNNARSSPLTIVACSCIRIRMGCRATCSGNMASRPDTRGLQHGSLQVPLVVWTIDEDRCQAHRRSSGSTRLPDREIGRNGHTSKRFSHVSARGDGRGHHVTITANAERNRIVWQATCQIGMDLTLNPGMCGQLV